MNDSRGPSMVPIGVIIFNDAVEINDKHLMCSVYMQVHLGQGSVLKYFNCLHKLYVKYQVSTLKLLIMLHPPFFTHSLSNQRSSCILNEQANVKNRKCIHILYLPSDTVAILVKNQFDNVYRVCKF